MIHVVGCLCLNAHPRAEYSRTCDHAVSPDAEMARTLISVHRKTCNHVGNTNHHSILQFFKRPPKFFSVRLSLSAPCGNRSDRGCSDPPDRAWCKSEQVVVYILASRYSPDSIVQTPSALRRISQSNSRNQIPFP